MPHLPEAVVAQIVQQIPYKQRLAGCALVNRSWAALCSLIPSSDVQTALEDTDSCQSLHAWLQHHGGHVCTLEVANAGVTTRPQLELPNCSLPKLQRLSVKRLDLTLCSSTPLLQPLLQQTGDPAAHAAPEHASSSQDHSGGGSSTAGGSSAANSPSDSTQPSVASPAACLELLPQLQQLQLTQCTLPLPSIMLLSRLTSLTSLQIQTPQGYHPDAASPFAAMGTAMTAPELSQALSRSLQQLTNLEDLVLSAPATEVLSLQARSLPLQRLKLAGGFAAGALANLPAALTLLQLQPSSSNGCQHLKAGIGLVQLTNLRHLHLHRCTIPAAILARLTSLQHLTLARACAVPSDPGDAGNADGMWGYQQLGTSRVNALLVALRQLQHLRHLELQYMNDSAAVEALSLTQLTALQITEQGQPTECGALQKVLQGRRLPQLRLLHLVAEPITPISCSPAASSKTEASSSSGSRRSSTGGNSGCGTRRSDSGSSSSSGSNRAHSWDHRGKASSLGGRDLGCIVECCPGLQDLALCGVVGPTVFTWPLQHLSSLQSLSVAGAAFKDSSAAAVAQIGGLQAVQWLDSPLTVTGVQQLTALTRLTQLKAVAVCPRASDLGLQDGSTAPASSASKCTMGEPRQQGSSRMPTPWSEEVVLQCTEVSQCSGIPRC
jgi:uncharacterized membrane protein YgcG